MLQYMHKLSKRNVILQGIKPPSERGCKDDMKRNVFNYVRLFKSYKSLIEDTANMAPSFLRVNKEQKELDLQNSKRLFGIFILILGRKARLIPKEVFGQLQMFHQQNKIFRPAGIPSKSLKGIQFCGFDY